MGELYGWMGKILRVNLSNGQISTEDTSEYVPKFIGGKGIANRIAWKEIPRGTGAFDPENKLIITNGPLTGTLAPTSGRGEVAGVGAQQLPEMYSWSGVGGWFPAELKFAGYDAVIIEGKASYPSYLWINDDEVEIKDASHLWGLGTYDAQIELKRKHGDDVRSLAIGPAGENLSRIAVLLTDTENAAGQGGFGGVAGSKNLKAVCVRGTKKVKVARPQELLMIRKETSAKLSQDPALESGSWGFDGHIIDELPYRRHPVSCSYGCDRHCFEMFENVPRKTRPGLHSQQLGCIGACIPGWQTPFGMDWPLYYQGFESGFEASELINQYGLNEWEILGGMIVWICQAKAAGVLTEEIYGGPIDPNDGYWWRDFLHKIAYREGFGDLLTEGTTRAINTLGKEKFGETMYHGLRRWPESKLPPEGGPQVDTPISLQHSWGFAGHDDGREIHPHVPYPDWLIRALMWMHTTRDPQNDGHVQAAIEWTKEFRGADNPYRSERIPFTAIFNEHRAELKACLTLCDWAFPRPWGDQQNAEARLFSAVTGIDTTEEELDKMGERIRNQFRALIVRNYDRHRAMEYEEIIPWYKRPDSKGIAIDEAEFQYTIDNYLKQRGWDKATGWPTRAKLEELGLKDVADELASIGKLP